MYMKINHLILLLKLHQQLYLIRKALNIPKGSGEPNRENGWKNLTRKQLEEIAKAKEPDLNANDLDACGKIIAGTARSMGVDVEI